MTWIKVFWARRAAIVPVIAVLLFAGLGPGRAAGLDPVKMTTDEIKALEQRLTDAGCYKGAIDGAAATALDDAIKACPDQRPFLRIETGMHTGPINRIAADSACSLLATTSDDKTVRLWSLPDGKLHQVMRLPMGEGDSGKTWAIRISPHAQLMGLSRQDGFSLGDGTAAALYLYQIGKTGEPSLLRRTTFGSRVIAIAFSGDESRLAVGFKGPQGAGVVAGAQGGRVIDVKSGHELLADADYQSDVIGLAFAPDGALIASSWDGQLRRYGPDLKLTAKRAAPDGEKPSGIAIDPAGRRVAIGYMDEAAVSILDAKTLVPLAKTQTSDLDHGDFFSVAWSHNGATLIAGGTATARRQDEWRNFLRRFDRDGRSQGADIGVSGDTIMDIQPCGQGFAFAAAIHCSGSSPYRVP